MSAAVAGIILSARMAPKAEKAIIRIDRTGREEGFYFYYDFLSYALSPDTFTIGFALWAIVSKYLYFMVSFKILKV